LFFDTTTGALPMLKGGQVKGLGVLMAERMKDASDIPTMKEQGLPNLAFDAWMGIFAPANTPRLVIERLQKEIAASMPDLKARFAAAGGDTIDIEASRLQSFVRSEHDTWTKLIKDAGITIE
jgi:tripartite-type tricarboxylate transporter receptor subunit TctC